MKALFVGAFNNNLCSRGLLRDCENIANESFAALVTILPPQVFTKLREENRGKVTVFYCGNPLLATTLRKKCQEFGFRFRKEVF